MVKIRDAMDCARSGRDCDAVVVEAWLTTVASISKKLAELRRQMGGVGLRQLHWSSNACSDIVKGIEEVLLIDAGP